LYLLVTTGHPDMARYAHPNLGRLVQPRHYSSVRATAEQGVPWAADNDCFQGLDEQAYRTMLAAIDGLPGCRFVTVPDVVGDHDATLALWREWHGFVGAAQPPAFVLQDGVSVDTVPWDECAATFIGGGDSFKLGPDARLLARETKRRGLWLHMGRVNSHSRLRYAASLGCDSVDGTMWTKWKSTHLAKGLEWVREVSAFASDQLELA